MSHTIKDFVDLTDPQRELLEAFERDVDLCQTFYFTGGTLLKALGIVPRISNDLDFFSFPGVSGRAIVSQRMRFRDLCGTVFGANTIGDTQQGIIHRPSGTVIDIVADDIKNIGDFVSFGNVKTASIEDCAANKASALCSRDEVKDVIDLALLTRVREWNLCDLEELAEKKFGLGTVTEEKLLTELIAKRTQFDIPSEIFLREPEANRAAVQERVAFLIQESSL